MSVWYIKQNKEQNLFVNKLKQMLNIIEIEKIDGNIFCKLSIDEKTKIKKIKTIAKKLNNELYKECIENVVLSNDLDAFIVLKNELYSENINILDGRILFQYLILDVIEFIFQGKKIEEGKITILVNDNTELNLQNIIEISKKVKRVNIVTNNIQKFKKVEEYLYNELGIMIRISNNKKKDLLNSDVIINIDFPKEVLKKYQLSNKCILLNINEEYEVEAKKFSGINVNYYDIKIPNDYKLEGFKDELIYESYIYNKPIDTVKNIIKKDKIEIKSLIGINGSIDKNEFMKLGT